MIKATFFYFLTWSSHILETLEIVFVVHIIGFDLWTRPAEVSWCGCKKHTPIVIHI